MSQENIEVAREAIEAWNAGDMDRLRELYDADAVMRYTASKHAFWRTAGRGPESDMEIAWVYTLRRGLIVSAEFFQDHAEALEVAGLTD